MSNSAIESHPHQVSETLSHLCLNDSGPESTTMLTLLRGPVEKKSCENNVRHWFSFGFNSDSFNHHHPIRHVDRPRLVTNWKTETETQKQIANSLDSPPPPMDQLSLPDSTESVEPLNLRSIPDEVLLPFGEREKEIMHLLNEQQNIGLYHRLKDLWGSRESKIESEILKASRSVINDREWFKLMQTSIEPLDLNLWVRFRGLIGADGLDQETEPSGEHDWFIQPLKVRRSSTRSCERRRRIVGLLDRPSRDSFISVFGDSDQESVISVASHSPIKMMESIQEQELYENEQAMPIYTQDPTETDDLAKLCNSSTMPALSDSDSDEPDENHAIALKILERPPCSHQDSLAGVEYSPSCPSHGLKYSFGQVAQQGLGLQSS